MPNKHLNVLVIQRQTWPIGCLQLGRRSTNCVPRELHSKSERSMRPYFSNAGAGKQANKSAKSMLVWLKPAIVVCEIVTFAVGGSNSHRCQNAKKVLRRPSMYTRAIQTASRSCLLRGTAIWHRKRVMQQGRDVMPQPCKHNRGACGESCVCMVCVRGFAAFGVANGLGYPTSSRRR